MTYRNDPNININCPTIEWLRPGKFTIIFLIASGIIAAIMLLCLYNYNHTVEEGKQADAMYQNLQNNIEKGKRESDAKRKQEMDGYIRWIDERSAETNRLIEVEKQKILNH